MNMSYLEWQAIDGNALLEDLEKIIAAVYAPPNSAYPGASKPARAKR